MILNRIKKTDVLDRNKIKSEVYTGDNGSELSFKKLSGSNINIIHIATHGYYWTEREFKRNVAPELGLSLEMQNQYDLLLVNSLDLAKRPSQPICAKNKFLIFRLLLFQILRFRVFRQAVLP